MIETIGMMAQLCFVEVECIGKLDDVYYNATDVAESPHNLFSEDIAFATILVAFIVFGVVFNIVTIVTLSTGKRSSKEVRVQLINLAIADCVWALVGPVINLHIRLEKPMTSNAVICKFTNFMGFLMITVSPLCSVAISIDRFVAVYFPMKIIHYRTRHKIMTAVFVWLIGTLVDMGSLYNSHIAEVRNQLWCYGAPIRYKEPMPFEKFAIVSGVKFALPSIIIVIMYSLIAAKLKQRQDIGESCANKADQRKRINHALKVLCTDAVFTLLTWLPYTIFQVISTNYVLESTTETMSNDIPTIKLMYRIQGALTVMLFTNCFSSPVIYFCFNKAFREDLQSLLNRCSSRSNNRRRHTDGSSEDRRITSLLSVPNHKTLTVSLSNLSCLSSNVDSEDGK